MAKPKRSKTGIFSLMVTFNHQRRNLTIGKVERSRATLFAASIDALVSHRKHSPGQDIPKSLESFVMSLSAKHRQQLGELGLLNRFDPDISINELILEFRKDYEAQIDIAESTKEQFRQATSRFPKFFFKAQVADVEPTCKSERRNSKPIFSDDTKQFVRNVESWQREHYARASWSKANKRMRQVGKWAVEQGICDYNPFSILLCPGETNDERNEHVERDWVLDAMDYCLDPDTRLMFALGRFAGFRLPSEARTLKPHHIDFDKLKLEIFDSKKKKIRVMPLFDDIADELIQHQKAVKWDRFVLSIRTRRNTDSANYQLMAEAINRTQWDKWERLRQNLRTSCENDLLNAGFVERLVAVWLGHTVKVSRQHYQHQTDADYLRAVEKTRQKR